MLKFAIVMVPLVLAGCAQQRIAEARAAAEREVAVCKATIPLEVGRTLEYMKCAGAAYERHKLPGDTTTSLLVAARLSIAARIDRREITMEDGRLEFENFRFEVNQRAAQTNAQQRAADAANAAAYLPLLQNPWNANCTTVGGVTNCYGSR